MQAGLSKPTDPLCSQQLWMCPQPNANNSLSWLAWSLEPKGLCTCSLCRAGEHKCCCLHSCGLAEHLQPGSQPLPAPQLLLSPADTDGGSQQHLLTHLHGMGLSCHTPAPWVLPSARGMPSLRTLRHIQQEYWFFHPFKWMSCVQVCQDTHWHSRN